MRTRKELNRNHLIGLACGCALALSQAPALALTQSASVARPKINLFPTSVVESLSETSRAARDMESEMYDVVARLDKQKEAYQSTQCDNSDVVIDASQIAPQCAPPSPSPKAVRGWSSIVLTESRL